MKKKLLSLLLVGLMGASIVACGDTGSGSTSSGDSGKSIRLVNGKIEVDSQLKKLAEMYEEETGVHVEIESMGGGIDIQGELKAYYQSDNMPDIFVCGGAADFDNWDGLLQDMSDQAWVSDTDAAYTSDDGVVGFPYTTEAVGLAYNADILSAAGVDPASITGPESMRKAFETIDSKKDELGLTAVIGYYAEPVNLYWSTGNHLFGNYLDAGLDRDDRTYIDMLSDGGKLDDARFADFADMVELFNEYADQSLLVSGTYDQQILNFASGKYAFVTQGSWIGATMTGDDADAYKEAGNFECGMIPYAFEEGIDTILTNSPSWWAVYNGGNVTEAEAFLQWMAGDEAQEVLVMEAGFISPYKSCTYVANDPFAETISEYTAAGKTSAWHWLEMTDGYSQNYTGQVFADFASGTLSKEEFISTFKQVTENAYAQ
ncbi:raffinose/stachyose/melibiose transport system substrate-binding protein [Pseudobutyrivibrio ruminis]|uniref:Raffinose/stachyose/melibiose transport system substrate-binding protein n=1 Tax=Pseudobutyrivibrio ruminis TaxID=46206 RepID=A0A1H7JLY0_9FIRM|nr:ABC transporter substrate-binding protein [Pseudobutyrivibrio ruminis]SEK75571.1 raffinose/stachyose/melibiose transport system substrate-binding protein [Pseudobutyrivibrio ruminis]